MKDKKQASSKTCGAAALVTVIIMGGIIMEVSIASLLIVFFLEQSGFGAKLSDEAVSAAHSGIEDAIIKIVRDKNIVSACSPDFYSLSVGSRSAEVSICDVPLNERRKEIISIGAAGSKKRKLEAIIDVNPETGKTEIISIKEVSL